MTFEVAAELYDRFVGRYGPGLGRALARAAGVRPPMRALDVGCGPGALTAVLAELLGPERVAAVDPSAPFLAAVRERLPGVEAQLGTAEELPFEDGEFDAALAQLVVNFMADPERGVGEMQRVTKPGGVVAAAVWDYGGEMTLLRTCWEAAEALHGDRAGAVDERSRMRFGREGELAELWRSLGFHDVEEGELVVPAEYESFDELWAPLPGGVGPAGAFVSSLEPAEQERFRTELQRRLGAPSGSFRLTARAWYAVGTV